MKLLKELTVQRDSLIIKLDDVQHFLTVCKILSLSTEINFKTLLISFAHYCLMVQRDSLIIELDDLVDHPAASLTSSWFVQTWFRLYRV
jgi:hypothetical protein